MLAVAFRFPAGRYHATPWGRHVNEADVEWPPAPWRILRALIATWHRKAHAANHPEAVLDRLIETLVASLPVYALPPAVSAHSRHYMPVRSGKQDKSVLIFDAFVHLDAAATLVAAWPDIELAPEERELLNALLRDLGFLGRAESWTEASALDTWDGRANCRPSELAVDTESGEALEPVRLIAPLAPIDYDAWRSETIAAHGLEARPLGASCKRVLATLPQRLIDALRLENADVQRAGWSCPPGARFVTYQRPYACFRPQPRARISRRSRPKRRITTARLELIGKPLPRLEDAVRIGELVRVAAIHKADRLTGTEGIPAVLSGHNLRVNNRHGHAFYLPEDADGDGFIDHVLIHADDGLPRPALRALDRITRLWRDGAEWQVILEQYGTAAEIRGSAYLGTSSTWRSATPYLHPWFAKKSFTVEDQIRRECRERDLTEPDVLEPLPGVSIKNRSRRPVHFHRFRSRRGLTQPDRKGSFWKITFPTPVTGPVALGFGCHYGLGVFGREVDR